MFKEMHFAITLKPINGVESTCDLALQGRNVFSQIHTVKRMQETFS